MNLELHHFFILVEPEAKVAELLLAIGMHEGAPNRHKGQGTSNRRFNFSNGMLELLWVHDHKEAINGPGRNLLFSERVNNNKASPFGVVLSRKDNSKLAMPFEGWKYEPAYFEPPWAFHIGENSQTIDEPLCIYMPFIEPQGTIYTPMEGSFTSISHVRISTPSGPLSNVLSIAGAADRLTIENGDQHLMEVTFNDKQSGLSRDLRPDIPLVINW
ncbi:MAG: hypothetical protein ACC707_14335 [Thiohalomonadales bacterium]